MSSRVERSGARRWRVSHSCVVAALSALLAAGTGSALAQVGAQAGASPVGAWRTIDDETKKPKALVRISESAGTLSGRIEKILTDRTDARCEECSGELKDKPVLGMTILNGLKKGEEWWEGGTILDPATGKTYRARLRLVENDSKLEVRGYIGAPLLGRSQTWLREP